MMEYKTVRSFFMRFTKDTLLKICNDNELAGEIEKTLCTKDYLSRLLVEHTMVSNEMKYYSGNKLIGL